MGVIENITHNKYPKQSNNLGKKVNICFHYNTENKIEAFIIRDDIEDPGETIFLTLDGRIIRSTECQYQFPDKDAEVKDELVIRFNQKS